MQTFDLTAHYSLLQAFDLTGRRIFGDDWTGTEAWTRQSDDPAISIAARATIAQEIVDLSRSMAELSAQVNYPANPEQKEGAQTRYIELSKQRREAEHRHRHFAGDYDNWIADHAAFVRKSKVEELIMGAFASGDLEMLYREGAVVPLQDWRLRGAFRVYLNLSLIRVPRNMRSGQGIVQSDRDSTITQDNRYHEPSRYAAFVSADEFHTWVQRYGDGPDVPGTLVPAEQCRILLNRMIDSAPNAVLKKPDCWQACKEKIPELTKRGFDKIWAMEAPDNWQRGGRRSE